MIASLSLILFCCVPFAVAAALADGDVPGLCDHRRLSLATHRHPLANPVLHSIWIIGAFLLLTGTSYAAYFGGAQFVHFLLGPATVALAVPLYESRKVVAAAILPMLAALVVGSR